jgi:hypothetical protein
MERDVRERVNQLIAAGLTPGDIAEKMEGRVSARTIYRWAQGKSAPGNQNDLEALFAIPLEKA